jgi:NADPH-dependent 2,4-dienoyl-CoA reductase/sulfur reductase-like enzyme
LTKESREVSSSRETRFEVLVVGGGPAGIAAASTAAKCGLRTGIVDDNPNLGGQIWRTGITNNSHAQGAPWLRRIQNSGVTVLSGMRVVHQPEAGRLLAEASDGISEFAYDKLILATGARERFLPFPGWTLPNVMGAGGLQAMVRAGLPIRGKRVVIAGTGPLLLAVAAYLRKHGAKIQAICEQAGWAGVAKFGFGISRWPSKIVQGMELMFDAGGNQILSNSWPAVAHGDQKLEAVTIVHAGRAKTIACDYLGCGFHLVPNIELPVLLGCATANGFVRVDDFQQTSVESVYCAGEPTSIGGVELALLEGQTAGLAAAGHKADAKLLFVRREAARKFAKLLNKTFCLRPQLKSLALPDTIVCRCEDVTHARLRSHNSWQSAKLHTRCGMGTCQGRICGPATEFLFQWNPVSLRPPIFPARIETLTAASIDQHEPSTVI